MYNLILAFIAMFLLSACSGGSGTGSSDTGSISFNVDWDRQSAESVKSAIRASSDVCSDYGIETVNADVINSSSSSVASGSWACSAHSGTISSVPVGSGYTARLEGLDSSGTVTWSGEITGISVSSGSTSSAGTITMTYIGSDSTPPYIVSFNPTENAADTPVTTAITATFNEKIAPSTITTDTFTLFDYGANSYVSGSVTYDSSTKTATFTPASNLSYSTQYQAWVHPGTGGVQDMAGWLLTGTSEWYFTTEDEPTSAPSAPTGVSAAAGDSEVEITWTASTGATSYNIYWSNSTGVTKTNGTQITGATSPYIHTTLSNGTIYYYVVTAQNSYGESTESSQVSATPNSTPAATGRMPDTNQTTSYTSTFGEDSDYTINPPSYTDNGDGTITDNVTGLVWQKQDDGTTRTWADAGAYCEASTLGGYSDWRLPSQIELISIVDYGVYVPAINTTYFPGTVSSYYWSSTAYASYTSSVWEVNFNDGGMYGYSKTNSYYVRCVRGGQTTQSLTDNGNGTVTDSGTNLTWQQGENSAMTWEAALSFCEGFTLATYTDWRLPNIKELSSLVDDTRYAPAINTTYFPSTSSSYYWLSTTGAFDTLPAWYVNFNDGSTSTYNKTNSVYVRCVRGGQ